jgi:dihydropteroate synthase
MDTSLVYELQCGPFRLVLGKRTLIMGVLNVTPDSFSDGGLFFDKEKAIAHGEALARAGADMIDVGGESSRPFSQPVPEDEEIRRVVPVIEALAGRLSVPISIDTCKANVAKQAINAGAVMVNDIGSLGSDPAMADVVVHAGIPIILMHMQGMPRDMQVNPSYDDVVADVKRFLGNAIHRATLAGVDRRKIIVDPGIGFGKTVNHNLLLLKYLSALHGLHVPVLIGTSRKSFIAKLLGDDMERREAGTQATLAAAALQGAHIVRVHDVRRSKETLQIIDAIRNAVQE